MLTANLANALNAFYRQNPGFPKPDLASSESMMVGMEPSQAGMRGGDIIFGQLSPLHEITLDEETKAAANIPAVATTFAWAYPMLLMPGQQLPARPADRAFMEFGGYVYFDDFRNAVGTNAIQPARLGTLGLMFGRPQLLTKAVADQLTRQGRFQEITLQALADKEATHFAWIRPGEFPNDVASFDGCFAYKFADESLKYFPIVSKPVFTKELLDETLDDSESWVVVRMPFPSIERINIYDKTKPLEDNLYNNDSHGLEFNGNVSGVHVRREGRLSRSLSYDMWCNTDDPGTISDPWIFELELTSNVLPHNTPVETNPPPAECGVSVSVDAPAAVDCEVSLTDPVSNKLESPTAFHGNNFELGPSAPRSDGNIGVQGGDVNTAGGAPRRDDVQMGHTDDIESILVTTRPAVACHDTDTKADPTLRPERGLKSPLLAQPVPEPAHAWEVDAGARPNDVEVAPAVGSVEAGLGTQLDVEIGPAIGGETGSAAARPDNDVEVGLAAQPSGALGAGSVPTWPATPKSCSVASSVPPYALE
eukprot:CAMPEP_0171151410 /NCGR_PEP_ID=MMETSP0766_2-20121228/150056_1 /TAXON_ID=439317 /ORGANISM="Gambierdiscus australes, Strain CAWD 149" /LENGTH=535 /DNA_ID=CAMNT_0011615325 /DNA_START=70 /DNA_END=1677 /DNA_ORIENTATION=-